MLIFIGGAARTGKGILARRLLSEMQLPYLSLDVLKMGLTRGAPEFPIDPDAGGVHVAQRLWPLVREMSASLLHDEIDYVFEGELLPQDVAALRHNHPTQICACFLGYSTIAPRQKLHEVRAYAGLPNDWPQEYSDAALLTILKREIAFSQFVQSECAQYHLPYFDSSHRFRPALDEVMDYIQRVVQAGKAEDKDMTEEKIQGPASYFPSIEKKYGRPVAHWFTLLESVKELKHMEMVNWLKAEHGLGHGHANALVAYFRGKNNL